MAVPSSCIECSRRAILRGIGVAVAGGVVAACGGGGGGGTTVDAPPPDSPGSGSCPTGDMCLDITQAAYSALATVGGSVYVSTSVGRLIVVRSSSTAVEALSSACTHQGVTVNYSSSAMNLQCPAHGAKFSLTGSVLQGPAGTPLNAYTTTLSGNTVTIKLA